MATALIVTVRWTCRRREPESSAADVESAAGDERARQAGVAKGAVVHRVRQVVDPQEQRQLGAQAELPPAVTSA